MSLIDQAMISRYDLQLQNMQESLKGHDQAWVDVLQTWREELQQVCDDAALKSHAARTARSMGGMESLGEVATTLNDSRALHALEELYAICKFILTS